MKRAALYCLAGCLLFSALLPAFAQEPSAREIAKRSQELLWDGSRKGVFTLIIVTPNRERRLKFQVYAKPPDKTLLRIVSPENEKDRATLRLGEEIRNYLPGMGRAIHIAPSMLRQPWMGSDFSYDDLLRCRSLIVDYELVASGEENIDGRAAYRIEATARKIDNALWPRRVLFVDKKTFAPVREEFYDAKGRIAKKLVYSGFKKVGGRLIPTIWEMTSETRSNRRSIIEVDAQMEYNGHIEDDLFTLSGIKEE